MLGNENGERQGKVNRKRREQTKKEKRKRKERKYSKSVFISLIEVHALNILPESLTALRHLTDLRIVNLFYIFFSSFFIQHFINRLGAFNHFIYNFFLDQLIN